MLRTIKTLHHFGLTPLVWYSSCFAVKVNMPLFFQATCALHSAFSDPVHQVLSEHKLYLVSPQPESSNVPLESTRDMLTGKYPSTLCLFCFVIPHSMSFFTHAWFCSDVVEDRVG